MGIFMGVCVWKCINSIMCPEEERFGDSTKVHRMHQPQAVGASFWHREGREATADLANSGYKDGKQEQNAT